MQTNSVQPEVEPSVEAILQHSRQQNIPRTIPHNIPQNIAQNVQANVQGVALPMTTLHMMKGSKLFKLCFAGSLFLFIIAGILNMVMISAHRKSGLRTAAWILQGLALGLSLGVIIMFCNFKNRVRMGLYKPGMMYMSPSMIYGGYSDQQQLIM